VNPRDDHYATLDLPSDATDAEIKRRYRKLMREVHPDANAHDPQATRKAARINAAFETLGDRERRRAYDEAAGVARRPAARNGKYAFWAEQPDWEDIVAEHVPPKRPAHVHTEAPYIEPDEIEVDMAELRTQPRARRTLTVVNPCECTLAGDVSTSEPWVWGPVGQIHVPPGGRASFDVEVIARKVAFPGLSRIVFVSKEWTGTVPVRITGYAPKLRRTYPATSSAYVPPRRRRAVRPR
jgi:hypothetical protein